MSKDIDFDELDKAVNSLMGTVAPDTSDEDPKAKTLRINSTLQPGERPAYNRLDEVAKRIGSETLVLEGERTTVEDLDALQLGSTAPALPVMATTTPPTETPLPVRATTEPSKQPLAPKPASGRFMDVVHPSSDMRTATNDALPLVVPERDVAVSVAEPVEDSPQPEVESQPEATAAATEPVAPPVTDIPLTPFLPDAKVEKRPLGGMTFASDEPKGENEERIVEELGDEPASDEPLETKPDTVKELAAIEPTLEAVLDDPQKEAVADTSARIPPEAAESIRAVESGDTEKLSAAAQSGGIVGAQFGDSDQNDGAIYDVDNQPQPLGHPTKQKSGWGTVLIILIVIVVSAALGAAAYFILGLGA